MTKAFDKKMESDQLRFERVTNAGMICHDCTNRIDRFPAECTMYTQKPREVLQRKFDFKCPYYEQESGKTNGFN